MLNTFFHTWTGHRIGHSDQLYVYSISGMPCENYLYHKLINTIATECTDNDSCIFRFEFPHSNSNSSSTNNFGSRLGLRIRIFHCVASKMTSLWHRVCLLVWHTFGMYLLENHLICSSNPSHRMCYAQFVHHPHNVHKQSYTTVLPFYPEYGLGECVCIGL